MSSKKKRGKPTTGTRRRLQAKFPFVWLVQSVLTKPHWLNNVEPSDCNSASHRTCRSATFRLHSINSPGTDMKKNEFRVSEVPPGSVLLMGDVAGFSVAGGFFAPQAM